MIGAAIVVRTTATSTTLNRFSWLSRPRPRPRPTTTIPTSPRGAMPTPTVTALQRPAPHAPITPASTLVAMPRMARTIALIASAGSRSADRSTRAPVTAKKNGVMMELSGWMSCSISSCASVSAMIRPATNAPMIAARPMRAERIARASMMRKTGTRGVSAKSGQVKTSRRRPRARRAIAKPRMTKPTPPTTRPSVARPRSPEAAPATTTMRIRARMSSITAAPMMILLNFRSRTPRSESTRLVIPMLVAARARPTNAAVVGASPTRRA